MNLYFLVEGKTEREVYPKLLSCLLPGFSRVNSPDVVAENNYFLISGGGFPGLIDNFLKASVEDVNDSGNYDFFIICLDSDDMLPEDKEKMILDLIKNCNLTAPCKFQVIVQQKCMETWFMGNKKIYPRSPSADFKPFFRFYNVREDDPELMDKPDGFDENCSKYHCKYLKNMLREKGLRYSKNRPQAVTQPHYIRELKKRILDKPEHLGTLRTFFEFCNSLS